MIPDNGDSQKERDFLEQDILNSTDDITQEHTQEPVMHEGERPLSFEESVGDSPLLEAEVPAALADDGAMVALGEDAPVISLQDQITHDPSAARNMRAAERKKRLRRTLAISLTTLLALIGIGYFAVQAILSTGAIHSFVPEGDVRELAPMYVFTGEDVEILFPIRNTSDKPKTLKANFGKHGSTKVEMEPNAVTPVPISIFNIKEPTEVVLTYAKGETMRCRIIVVEPNQVYLDENSIRVESQNAPESNPVETPFICQPGEMIRISFTVKNESGLEFKREIIPNINGEDKETLVAFFEEGQEEVTLSFEYLCEKEGEYNITLDSVGFPLLCYTNNDNKLGNSRIIFTNAIEQKGTNFLFTIENKTEKGFFLYLTNEDETKTLFKMYVPPKLKAEVPNLKSGTYRAFVGFGEYYNTTLGGYVLPGTTFKFKDAYTFINTEEKWNKISIVVTGTGGSGTATPTESVEFSVIPPI